MNYPGESPTLWITLIRHSATFSWLAAADISHHKTAITKESKQGNTSSFYVSRSVAELTSIVAIPKTRKQETMFSDLELATVALVFVFTLILVCIMLARRNDNVRERTPTRKPRKRLRMTRRHRLSDDLYHMTQREPKENTDEESYNMR